MTWTKTDHVLIHIHSGPTNTLLGSTSCEQRIYFKYFKRDVNYKSILYYFNPTSIACPKLIPPSNYFDDLPTEHRLDE